MADLSTNFLGVKSPNPFWLASAPPTDRKVNVERAFRAGWGGVVWKTLGEAGPPIVNVSGARYGAIHGPDRRLIAMNNIELITDRDLEINLQRDQGGQARLARPRADRVADGALRREVLGGHSRPRRGDRMRRRRAQFRLPARHVGARHGLGRRPGARICRDGRALVQGAHPHAGHRQAHAQHHRHPPAGARGEEGRRRCGVAHQHHQFDHEHRSRPHDAGRRHRRQGHARGHVRPGGQADRALDGVGNRPRSRLRRPADLGHRRHHHLARRGRVHRARRRERCRSAPPR